MYFFYLLIDCILFNVHYKVTINWYKIYFDNKIISRLYVKNIWIVQWPKNFTFRLSPCYISKVVMCSKRWTLRVRCFTYFDMKAWQKRSKHNHFPSTTVFRCHRPIVAFNLLTWFARFLILQHLTLPSVAMLCLWQ